MKVLMVDDEADILKIFELWAPSQNITPLTAVCGKTALDILRQDHDPPIDLVLSDVRMPKMSGPELVKIMRSEKMDTDVVFVTGFHTLNLEEWQGLGVRAIWEKPTSWADFFGEIKSLLQGSNS